MSDDNEWYFDALDNDHDEEVNRTERCPRCGATDVHWIHQPGAMGGRGHSVLWNDEDRTPHNLTCPARIYDGGIKPEVHVTESAVKAIAKGAHAFPRLHESKPRVLVSANGHREIAWMEPIQFEPPTTKPKKKEKLVPEANPRTMYDLHKGSTGSIMICMMDDNHLRNTIRVIATNFINQRERLTPNNNEDDPMIQAMTRNQCWGPERLESETKSVLRNLSPYVLESAVRGGPVLADAQRWIQQITKRTKAVAAPDQVIMLTVEEDELP